MKVLVLDNYDSFTYNLVHLLSTITNNSVDVYLNDQIDLPAISNYDKILLSPGPGIPSEAGILLPLIKEYAQSKSILGICLGHQAIAEAFGGKLLNLETVFHGVSMKCHLDNSDAELFKGIPSVIETGRYHSWIVDEQSLPGELAITARDENNYIMAMKHRHFDLKSVQFHPESIMTPHGKQIIQNWMEI
jgi:anthranilate synthase component II